MPTPLPGTGSSRRASPLVAGSADAAGGLPDLRPFAESLDDVFWLADPERGELLYVSPAFEAVWGIPCEALHEAPSRWNEALLPADRPRLPEPFFAGRPGDASRELDYRIRRPDGAVRWIRDRRFAWRDAAGHVVRVGGIAEDVTARRQDAAHRDAARMPASEGFLAVIVHELRSPLNAIHGWTHVLRHGGGHAAAQLRALEAIERSVQAQARLIDELLDVQRVLQGALRLDLHEVPLASLLEGAVATCRPQAEARHQKLVLQRPPSMVRLHADGQRLHQALARLIAHVARFTPEHGEIAIRTRMAAQGIEIAVCPCDLATQTQGSTGHAAGAGLGSPSVAPRIGLVLARLLVELHEGQLHPPGTGGWSGHRLRGLAAALRRAPRSKASRGLTRCCNSRGVREAG